MAAIREEASKYGVATIVPPRSWHPRFNLRKDTLKFRVQIQHLAELQRRLHAEEGLKAFRDDYAEFLERQQDGTAGRGRADKAPPQKPPTLGGAVVDLGRLFRIVTELGGAQKVSETKKWKDVARLLKVRPRFSPRSVSPACAHPRLTRLWPSPPPPCFLRLASR